MSRPYKACIVIQGGPMHALPLMAQRRASAEYRRHRRVKVPALGRYMLSDEGEYCCQALDISPGGVALVAPVKGRVGERVICYLDHFGRVEGRIVRLFPSGFALKLQVPPSKIEKLADQLTWHANRVALGVAEDRRYDRIVPRETRTTVTVEGRMHPGEIVDVSVSGAALRSDAKVAIGDVIGIGQRSGRVIRSRNRSLAVEFLRLIPTELFDEALVL